MLGLQNWMDRFKIWDVQEDPEWQLGASLGDMEFEMDMFDDLQGDEDALRGLRQHSKEGLGRYADWWPLREKKSIFDRLFGGKEFSGAFGSFNPEMGYRPGPNNDPNIIDINMLNVLDRASEIDNTRWLDVQPGSLQDKISDVYRHEYKHAGGLEHPEIYSQWYQNQDPGFQAEDYRRDVATSYTAPDRGDWGPGVHLNRGGIVSLGLV
jgi:hypothetical protein|tara:strand:+ start:68 stop:694 length:627 start_codon:yes stop_codon:yes gene_type:complete